MSEDKFHDECGVFGILNHKDAANLVYLGLYALQHRGQESAGIASVEPGSKRILSEKEMGYVADIFTEARLLRLPGDTAIGHVRYSTAGGSMLCNAQPLVASTNKGVVAVAHNGNLVNGAELRRQLEADGAIFNSVSDTEVFVHLIARSKTQDLERAIIDALSQVTGAYSVAILSADRIYAARDPYGFRPLVLGRLDDALVVSSETCAFDLIAAESVREIRAGEVVAIERGDFRTVHQFPVGREARCVFEHVYFARPDSVVFGNNVAEVRQRFGAQLAREFPAAADVVVPVPDSGVFAALGFARESGIPFAYGLVRNHYVGRTFIEPKQSIRDFGVKVKLNPVRELVAGKRVVLIDDSIVRGTTSKKIVRMLKLAGAKEVHMRISSPPTVGPCYYGIDTPQRRDLIAGAKSNDEIREFIEADSLGYLSEGGMLEAVRNDDDPRRLYCTACFTGKYPVLSEDVEQFTAAPALSARLQGLFAPRIQQLPESTRAFLLLAALDVSGELRLILTAAGGRGSEADARLCMQMGLVSLDPSAETLRFTHPLARSTAVALATWVERREAHRALAAAEVGHVQRRAQHLSAAAVGPDESVASLLEDAAQELLRRGDAGGAVTALLQSAELSAQPRQRARRLAQAAYVGADVTGELDQVSSLLAQARREIPPAEQSLETATAAAYLLLNGDGDVDTSHRLLVSALGNSEAAPVSDAARTGAVFTLLWICFFAGRHELWAAFAAELDRLGSVSPQTLRLCAATFATPAVTGAGARAELRGAIAALETEADPTQVILVARAAFYLDELAGCRAALWKVASGDDESGAVTPAINAWILLGFEAFLDGQWDEAVQYCERGLELSQRRGYELLSWPGRYGVAVVAAARGDNDVAASLCDEMLRWAQPRGVRSVMAYAHHAMAVAALGRRDFETAFRHASEVSVPGVIEPGLAHALWLMLDLVEAAVHSDRHAEAVAHVEAMRAAHVEELSSRYALIVAGCEAIVAAPEQALEAFERALRTREADRWPFELARIQLTYGEHLRRARQNTQARGQLLSVASVDDGGVAVGEDVLS